jgi:NitT/TauT family transport system permease protein
MRRTALRLVAPVVGVVGFLVSWQLVIHVFDIKRFLLPQPTDILHHLATAPGFYWRNSRATLREAGLGFALAFVVALAVATAMAHSRFVDRMLQPMAVLIQVTPIIAYAPAIVAWRGFGLQSVLIVTALVCFVPFLLNGVSGLRSVDPNLLELADSVDASRAEVFLRLRLPSSLPFLFSAARINVGLALIGAVLGEFFGGVTEGLGYGVKVAQAHNFPLQLWGCIFVLAAIGACATLALTGLERVVLRWHSSQRS